MRGANLFNLLHPLRPARGVVVLRLEALLRGVGEERDQRGRLRGRLAVASPGEFVVAVVVELLHLRLIVREVRPLQDRQLRRAYDLRHGVGVVGRILFGLRLAVMELREKRVPAALATGHGKQQKRE